MLVCVQLSRKWYNCGFPRVEFHIFEASLSYLAGFSTKIMSPYVLDSDVLALNFHVLLFPAGTWCRFNVFFTDPCWCFVATTNIYFQRRYNVIKLNVHMSTFWIDIEFINCKHLCIIWIMGIIWCSDPMINSTYMLWYLVVLKLFVHQTIFLKIVWQKFSKQEQNDLS